MPEVSVVFPMYNVSAYVRDSLTSVLNQTLRDFELIAVNDGSTDDTMRVFREVVDNARRDRYIDIKLIEKENGGLADARNAALAQAKGRYVVFVDSDDVIHPGYLSSLVGDAHNFGADLAVATFKNVTADTLFDFEETVCGRPIDKAELMNMLLLRKKFVTGCWALLISRELIERNGLSFNTSVRFSVDQAFIWQVIDAADTITVNYSKLYHYYLRPGSIMTATKKADLYSGVDHFTRVVSGLRHLPFDKSILLSRWKIGILHSTAKLTDYAGYREVKDKLGISYRECLRIPDGRIKALALLGMISDRALYRVFSK